jgi:hypothetical protein
MRRPCPAAGKTAVTISIQSSQYIYLLYHTTKAEKKKIQPLTELDFPGGL